MQLLKGVQKAWEWWVDNSTAAMPKPADTPPLPEDVDVKLLGQPVRCTINDLGRYDTDWYDAGTPPTKIIELSFFPASLATRLEIFDEDGSTLWEGDVRDLRGHFAALKQDAE